MLGNFPARAYPFGTSAQQNADRLIRTQGELNNVLTLLLAARPGPATTIRLGSDVLLNKPLELASFDYRCIFDGNGRYGFKAGVDFVGTELVGAGSASNILFRDMVFEAPIGMRLERMLRALGTLQNVSFQSCTVTRCKQLMQSATGATVRWQNSEFVDTRLQGLELTDTVGWGTAEYRRCLFERLYASRGSPAAFILVPVDDVSGSVSNVAIEAGPFTSGAFTAVGSSGVSGRLATVAELCLPATSQTIGGVSPVLSPAGTSSIAFTISAGATVSWSISTGDEGQVLFLRCLNNFPSLPLADTSLVRLAGPWTPTTSGTMLLYFSGGVWLEMSRSAN